MRDDEKTKIYENLKQEIRSLLISSPKTKYGGLTGALLYYDYKELNCGKEIPYAELGFHSLLALLRSMPDVVTIEYKLNSCSYRVHPVFNEKIAHIQKMVLEQNDKYEEQNRLYNQNWYFNNSNTMNSTNFYHHNDFPFKQKSSSYSENTFNYMKSNFQIRAYEIPKHFQEEKRTYSNKSKEKINFQSIDLSSHLSSTLFDHHEISSTPNTFIETSSNFDLDDYRLDQSSNIRNACAHDENKFSIIIDKVSMSTEYSPATPALIVAQEKSPLNNESLVHIFSDCNEQRECENDEDERLLKRLNAAICKCLHFRYIHRLCELKFQYRYYPLRNDTVAMKSQLESLAYDQYKKDLEEFQKKFPIERLIDHHLCGQIFDEYVYLQRNYYYMNKLLNTNRSHN
ncbi:unnamed protein product [Adineta ricciae]|uniref:HTH OST-type domain-containing protein n=1 Tax=Adineta ricciae TaxID=249248 RepID=A0A815QP73_ADIRI|nr:unnamed protein product [Adineta ricciae]